MLTSTPELMEMISYFDDLEHRLDVRVIDEAIERLEVMRGRDWEAFYYGRNELLSLLRVELELPPPEDG
jgi:hypothetical protein